MKKIKLQDGLDPRGEIQARRLKDKLLSNNLVDYAEKLKFNYDVYEKFKEYTNCKGEYSDFNSFMLAKYPVLYSAAKRAKISLMEIVVIMHKS